ncbi:MAG: 50S ribosomal protein L27, partial [Casimicrobiaceae bacterium]
IGPKITGLLHGAGIHTFEQLARTEVGALSKILDAAGPNFRLANPETWAQQAGLCARGEWEALKRLQDELVAGVRMKPETPDQA